MMILLILEGEGVRIICDETLSGSERGVWSVECGVQEEILADFF